MLFAFIFFAFLCLLFLFASGFMYIQFGFVCVIVIVYFVWFCLLLTNIDLVMFVGGILM